jgi:predicted metalloendopeptidase
MPSISFRAPIAGIMLAVLSATISAAQPSGVLTANMDTAVRPQDNFYKYVNGKWLATAKIPADLPAYGSYWTLRDSEQTQLRELIEAAAKSADPTSQTEAAKIGRLYAGYMDEARLNKLGAKPLATEFARIAALKDKRGIPALIAHLEQMGVTVPYSASIHLDNRDSTRYVADLGQDGLGLPDRDYYLKDDDAALKKVRGQYQEYIEASLARVGDHDAGAEASSIVALETELARAQWTKVENRDPVKTYNKIDIANLNSLASNYDWQRYLEAAGVAGKVDYVIVSQPSYLTGFGAVLEHTSLPIWKAYFRWHLLSHYARFLSKPFVDANFAFYSTALYGVPQIQPRWKRGVTLVDGAIADGVGKLYVAKYFPPASKARIEALVHNLLEAYRQDVGSLSWMSADTKAQALAKLAKITVKLGYPDKWRDYSKLEIEPDDLVGNVMRSNRFEYNYEVSKLGKPVDRTEWGMSPQTINAYYNPEMNEIVFPAAFLQPMEFNPEADDAVNYGAIGTTIGHEISHGFDDDGSQFDGDGNLHDWWSAEDHTQFAAKTHALVTEYSAFEPVAGYHVNGELTLGENIADNSGISIAYKAYKLSLAGKEAPVIDGLTGDQRFFIGQAQANCELDRENFLIVWLKTDHHTTSESRVNGMMMNQQAFYEAFGVKPGDKMYLPPEQRTTIW